MMAKAGASLRTLITAAILVTRALPAGSVEIIQGPTLTMDPNGTTPLAGVVELETDTPVQVQLTITGGSDSWSVDFPHAAQQHALPVLGLKPDRAYTVDVYTNPGGLAGSQPAVTGPLPADFPVVHAAVSDPQNMEPGFTLLDCFSRRSAGDTRETYTIVVDDSGEVVWYSTVCIKLSHWLVNGNLLYRYGRDVVEIDMLGNEIRRVTLADPGTGLHHDLMRTPMGTYLSLSATSVEIEDFPTSETDPGAPTQTASVRDEPAVEFLPDGKFRNEWRLSDILHPTRIGYDSLNPRAGGYDWVHTNAVSYDPNDDTVLVSARHQDAIVKISRATGDLVWILGPHDNWPPEFDAYLLTPVGVPFRWHYHPHAQMHTGDGSLVLFDNGNYRASPFDGNPTVPDYLNFSRGVEYEIDEETMEVRQVWEHGEHLAESLYSGAQGDADWLETTENVLLTFSWVSHVGGVSSADLGLGGLHARIIEATDDDPSAIVFELWVYDGQGGKIVIYRAERIPSLYAQEFVRPPAGVGATLRTVRVAGGSELNWIASPVGGSHDAADYYIVYSSDSPDGGFEMVDSTVLTQWTLVGSGEIEFYRVVAANTAGTSGDEPAP